MSIFMNEKIQAGLAAVNGKIDDGDLNGPDFFSEVFKTNSPNHLSVYAGELIPKTYKIDEEITFEKVRDKICADPAMAALMKKTEEKYADNAVTVKMRNPHNNSATSDEALNKLLAETAMVAVKEMMKENNIPPEMLPDDVLKQIIADNINQSEIDKLVSEIPPEVQTPMAEAFRTANKNRDRNRNRGRGHRE